MSVTVRINGATSVHQENEIPFLKFTPRVGVSQDILNDPNCYGPRWFVVHCSHNFRIEIIKTIRTISNAGLKEAKDFLDKILIVKWTNVNGVQTPISESITMPAHVLLAGLYPVFKAMLYQNCGEDLINEIRDFYPDLDSEINALKEEEAKARIDAEIEDKLIKWKSNFSDALTFAVYNCGKLGYDVPFRLVEIVSDNFKQKHFDIVVETGVEK
jgi:hypothetical protein